MTIQKATSEQALEAQVSNYPAIPDSLEQSPVVGGLMDRVARAVTLGSNPNICVHNRYRTGEPTMTTPDFRAELERLLDLYDALGGNWTPRNYTDTWNDALASTRAALATPPPEPPTDEEIEEWADAATEVPLEEMDPEIHGWRRCFAAKEFSETIRAAIERWGK